MTKISDLKAPFPWFGGKRRVASIVWQALGADVPTYIEPFAGSAAVLLARPGGAGKNEIINDADGYVANFWRAMRYAPDEVVRYADRPIHEIDMGAWCALLKSRRDDFTTRMKADPQFYDSELAGVWVWGQSASIPGNWTVSQGARPHRKCVASTTNARLRLNAITSRLRATMVMSGDWSRTVSSDSILRLDLEALTGVFLDPPYFNERADGCYAVDSFSVSEQVRLWCVEHGNDERLRLVLAGYDGEHRMPDGWAVVAWSAMGGHNSTIGRGQDNMSRERLWLSPHCLPVRDLTNGARWIRGGQNQERQPDLFG